MTGFTPENVLGPRLSAVRILVFGGVSLILAGMLLGEIFAIFISHVAAAQIRREWTTTMVPAIERRDFPIITAGYRRIEDLMERRGRIMDAHSHLVAYGFLALGLALLQPLSHFSESVRRRLAAGIVLGGLVQALSIFVSYWLPPPTRGGAFLASAAGGSLVLAGVVGNGLGLRGSSSRPGFAAETARRLDSAPSRILLRTGAALILLGMVFGFYYAWIFVSDHEPRQLTLFRSATEAALSGDSAAATGAILAYRGLMSRTAIVTAAHSHVVEMGIMAILLAFVQDFVFLAGRWKRRWATLFCAGAAIMPVCTYCASLYGLVFAGLADTFGMISVVAMFAMLGGLIRHTGFLEEGSTP